MPITPYRAFTVASKKKSAKLERELVSETLMKIRDLIVLAPILFSQVAWPDVVTTFSITSNADDGSPGTLRNALIQASTTLGPIKAPFDPIVVNIDFSGLSNRTITLSTALATLFACPATINKEPTTINFIGASAGNPVIIEGQNLYPALFIDSSSTTISNAFTVNITGLVFQNCKQRGGDGGTCAGGGAGIGGGLTLGQNVIAFVQDCTFTNCQAVGGNGGSTLFDASQASYGGGGGIGGAGGQPPGISGGGGGGGGYWGAGGNGSSGGGGAGGCYFTTGANASGDTGGAGASFHVGGIFFQGASGGNRNSSGVSPIDDTLTGSGGGGSGVGSGLSGGTGDDYAGGGGGALAIGGGGGFGGGGGGGLTGGNGGFGGGGGGIRTGSGGFGGYGAGNGGNGTLATPGGGGAGLGGAIFVRNTSSLTLLGNNTFSGNSVTGGVKGSGLVGQGTAQDGTGQGPDLFFNSGTNFTFSQSSDLTISTAIAGDSQNAAGTLIVNGTGKLTLSGTNTFLANIQVTGSTLNISNNSGLGNVANTVTLNGSGGTNGILQFGGNLSISNSISLGTVNTPTIDTQGNTVTLSGAVSGTGGFFQKIGSGTLILSGTNTYDTGTRINAGTVSVTAPAKLGTGTVTFTGNSTLQLSSAQTFNLPITVNAGIVGSVNTNGVNSTISSTISESASGGVLKKTGTGTLTLSAASNGYTGGTQIDAGTLSISSSGQLGTSPGPVTFTNNATLQFTSAIASFVPAVSLTAGVTGTIDTGSNNSTLAAAITSSGNGAFTKAGSGILTLNAACSYSGATTVSAGTLRAGGANVFASNSAVALTSGVTLDLNGNSNTIANLSGSAGSVTLGAAALTLGGDGNNSSFGGTISGTGGSLVKTGAGTLTLSGSNTYTLGTQINGGTISVASPSNLGSGTVTFGGNTTLKLNTAQTFNLPISVTAGFTATIDTSGSNSTLAAAITSGGNGAFTKAGSGILTLNTACSYSGTTTVSVGTLQAGGANVFASSSSVSLTTGTTLDLNGNNNAIANLSGAGAVSLGAGTLTLGSDNQSQTYTGSISGTSGGIVKQGSGVFIVSGSNSYSGSTQVTAGTLQTAAINTLPSTSEVVLSSGATLSLNGFSNTVGNLSGSAGTVTLGSGTLTMGAAGGSKSFSGTITGGGGIVKQGSGTMTLGGANGYTGGTQISAGALSISSSGNLSTGTVSFTGNSTLVLTGMGSYTFPVSVQNGITATFSVETSQATLTQPISSTTGGIVKTGDGILTLSGSSSYSGSTQVSVGTLQAGGNSVFSPNSVVTLSALTLLDVNNFTNTIANLSGSAGTVALGSGTLTFGSDGNTSSFGGTITGTSGSLIKTGSGVTTLSGTNSYSSTTQIQAGTLQAGSGSALSNNSLFSIATGATLSVNGNTCNIGNLSGSGAVSLGSGTLEFGSDNQSQTFSGNFSGTSGGILKAGNGTFVFSGSCSYSGPTQILLGTFQTAATNVLSSTSQVQLLGAGATLDLNGFSNTVANISALSGTISLGSGTLTFGSDGATTSFGGAINGTGGGLTKVGSGITTLGGSSSQTGATRVQVGTLRAGSTTGFSPSSTVAVSSGATLDLNNHSNTIASLSGAGVVSLGSATLSLGGDNTSTTFTGGITGSGGMIKNGTGTFSLNGTNTYTGATTVASGTLSVNGSMTSPVTVQSGAILKGIGTIIETVTVTGGTIFPGNSIGTLNIDGALVLDGSSTTNIEVSPSDNSLISITGVPGTAHLDGTLFIITQEGTIYVQGTEYIILQATGGLGGTTFASLSSDMPALGFHVAYFPTYVLLTIGSTAGTLSTQGLEDNSLILMRYLNSLPTALRGNVGLDLGPLTQPELDNALRTISPSRNSFSTFVAQNNAITVSSLLSHRMGQRRLLPFISDCAPCLPTECPEIAKKSSLPRNKHPFGCPEMVKESSPPCYEEVQCEKQPFNLWVDEIGIWSSQVAQHQNPSFHTFSSGPLFGFDLGAPDRYSAGVFVGFLNSRLHEGSQFGHEKIHQYLFGAYGAGSIREFFYEASLWGSSNCVHSKRNIFFSGFDQTAQAKWHAWQLVPRLKVGGDFAAWEEKFFQLNFEPYVSLDWPIYFQETYKEEGAGFYNMQIQGLTSTFREIQIGINSVQIWNFSSCSLFLKEGMGFIRRSPFATGKVKGGLTCCPAGFTVYSFRDDQNLGTASFELHVQSRKSVFGSLLFNGEIGPGYGAVELVAELGFAF